ERHEREPRRDHVGEIDGRRRGVRSGVTDGDRVDDVAAGRRIRRSFFRHEDVRLRERGSREEERREKKEGGAEGFHRAQDSPPRITSRPFGPCRYLEQLLKCGVIATL